MSRALTSIPSTPPTNAVTERPKNAEIAHFQAQAALVDSQLEPAPWADASEAIAPLFGLPMRDGDNDDDILDGLRASCHGEPLWAVKETVLAFRTGRIGSGYVPNSAEFGIALRKLTQPLREKGARFERERRNAEALADEAEHRGPMSPEARAAVARFLGKSRQVADEMREDLRRRPEVKMPRAGHGARVAQELAARRAARGEAQ